MSKVKIIQIAVAASDTDTWSEYLDDKGRVWYQTSVYQGKNDSGAPLYNYEWRQIDLPEEPKETTQTK